MFSRCIYTYATDSSAFLVLPCYETLISHDDNKPAPRPLDKHLASHLSKLVATSLQIQLPALPPRPHLPSRPHSLHLPTLIYSLPSSSPLNLKARISLDLRRDRRCKVKRGKSLKSSEEIQRRKFTSPAETLTA